MVQKTDKRGGTIVAGPQAQAAAAAAEAMPPPKKAKVCMLPVFGCGVARWSAVWSSLECLHHHGQAMSAYTPMFDISRGCGQTCKPECSMKTSALPPGILLYTYDSVKSTVQACKL